MKTRLYIFKNIKKYVFGIKGSIFLFILINLITIPTSLISPKLFQILIDEVFRDGNTKKFIVVALGLYILYVIRLVNDGASLILENRVLNKFTYNIRKDIFYKFCKAPYSFIEKKKIGELKMRMIDDVDALGNFIKEQIVDYILCLFSVVLSLYMVFRINIQMTLYCLAIVPFVFLLNYLIGNGTKKINEEVRKTNSEYYTSTHNSLQFWREIKVQNSEKTFIERFKKYRNILAKLGVKSMRYWAYKEVFNDFKSNYLTKVFIYVIGAFFVIRQELSVGVVIMFSQYFSMLFTALDGLNCKRVLLKTNSPYYERIFDTFSFQEDDIGKRYIDNFKREISIRKLEFSYIEGQPVLKNLNLQIKKGDYIAVVGKTGCGKTTLMKLLMGLYEIEKGDILYDGVPINEISKKSLYNLMAVVMQDGFLFNMSIRENLLLANQYASEVEIIEACKKANIYDFIISLPDEFETRIGEQGIKLSGGQKQRLLIAAALLRKPKILILDEATSNLDKLSEDIISDAIAEIAKDMTVIVITHKPQMAAKAKKFIIMENGAITTVATRNQFLNKRNSYDESIKGKKNEN